jgi:hypothetical protein
MEALVVQAINTLGASLATCGILIAWFNTDMLVQYIKLFRLTRFTYVEEYEKELFENPDLTYLNFAYFKEPSFINKLISCPYCVSFWVSSFCSYIATSNILTGFPCYALSLVLYLTFIKIFLKNA